MPRMKINGVERDFPSGINALEACKMAGIYVPHFCYHPVLKVVGSCRMCKVEVVQGGRSRIEISCNLPICEGLEIWTNTQVVQKAQQMTLEFLLANHPLDCPICDDAGECELQNYYLEYGRHDSRLREPKNRKFKAKDIGRSIMLDSERCILCSRCVRFCAEVTKTNELGIFGMGSTERIDLTPGARLNNDYAGCVVDLCPVGALTDKDFRFKRRVWFLKSKNSICQGCARGCNVRIDFDENPFHGHKKTFQMRSHRTEATALQRIQRLKPRFNEAVNGYWMCDAGRYGYKATDSADRLKHSLIRRNDELVSTHLQDGVRIIASGLFDALKNGPTKAAIVVSPALTSEELFAIKVLFRDKLKLSNIDHRLPIDEEWYGDDLLRSPDPFPNRIGAEWIGLIPEAGGIDIKRLEEAVLSGKVDTLITFLVDPRILLSVAALNKLKRRYFILRDITEEMKPFVDAALPAAAWGEYDGLFTNFHCLTQRCEQALEPYGDARPVWKLVSDIAAALKKPLNLETHHNALKALNEGVQFYRGMTWDKVGSAGLMQDAVNAPVKQVG
ncbi:MAG: 2Fe-2S iron-sulfur cluster binding domain-containing protein [Calditrichaeota bacterium]|nr:2Fe-2S iron-sulfur cluster binding domain-containing protein [Calditrichota bacterium]